MTLNWLHLQDKWQKKWQEAELGKATVKKNKDKFMMIFAYPGISGFLHVGHMRGYSYTDAICRYERLRGKEVLFPVGTHASGNQAIAFAKKVKNHDEKWVEYLLNNGCPEEKLNELTDPKKIVDYFNDVYLNDYWKKFGFICDWQRFTCTIYKDYEKFIQWQFQKLMQKDLLVQKPYFATFCPSCGPVAVDPSETDISKGGNAEKQEYTLLKFKLGNDYLVAATLRPETIYGQTNLWINPDAEYVKIEVDEETWILSREAAEKLKFQKDDILLKEDIDPKKLLGKKAMAPGINREIIILPASFCDPKVGSGIVTSVPSDAPYDYLALKIIQENQELCHKYGLNFEEVKSLKLIPIIKTEGYGDYPAKEIVETLKIHSLNDPQMEEATKEIYKAGYHTGLMRENCGKYSGKKVGEAKELIKMELLESGKADTFHDLSEEVICRCGTKVIVKRIDDQWFIKYSDPELTERSKEQAREMRIFPKEYYENMPSVLDWFGDRACARLGNWLGSKLPFDEQWTIEPISDSTLYPAFYIISKFTNSGKIKTEDLSEEFFDYVFLGKGIGKEEWKEVRDEFNYFYPLDINLGGKEHKTVHFPVFLMNHVAILPEEKWPHGIWVNGWITGKGGKISKSKGGAEPIPKVLEKYGADAMRLYYTHIGSPSADVIWDEEVVMNYKNALERIYTLSQSLIEINGKTHQSIDDWLISKTNKHLKQIHEQMKDYDLRELSTAVYFNFYEDFRWYLKRGGNNAKTVHEVLSVWLRLMNPITPHLSEEINEELGKAEHHKESHAKELISSSEWPKFDESKISLKAEAGEELVKGTIESIRNILKLKEWKFPTKVTLFVAENWLYQVFLIVSKELKVTHELGEILKVLLADEELKLKGKEVAKIVAGLVKDASKIPSLVTSQSEELKVVSEAKDYLKKEFNCPVEIVAAENSQDPKSKSAMPGRLGILVE